MYLPYRTTCTTIKSCLDAKDPMCVSGAPSNFFCWYVQEVMFLNHAQDSMLSPGDIYH